MNEEQKEMFEKALKELHNLAINSGIEIEIIGQWIWISGTTKEDAPALKKLGLGLKWHSKKQKWFFAGVPAKSYGKEYTFEEIKNKYGVLKVA